MKYSFFNNRNVARKNEERSKNPVLRELPKEFLGISISMEQSLARVRFEKL